VFILLNSVRYNLQFGLVVRYIEAIIRYRRTENWSRKAVHRKALLEFVTEGCQVLKKKMGPYSGPGQFTLSGYAVL